MSGAPLDWSGGRLEGTSWQGIRHVSLELPAAGPHEAVLTLHLNRPPGGLRARDILLRGGLTRTGLAYIVSFGADTAVLSFPRMGDHAPYTVSLAPSGGGVPVHPFFAEATFRFRLDCLVGDCGAVAEPAPAPRSDAPVVDLLTKDYAGFVQLMADWVRVRAPLWSDLSPASQERVIVELLAWQADQLSYYQDRVGAEAFLATATQRHSVRQHGALLGYRMDEGAAARTLLGFAVRGAGTLPAGIAFGQRVSPGEPEVVFRTEAEAVLRPENNSDRLVPAAFPGAAEASLPQGARGLLLWGHDPALSPGQALVLEQGGVRQVVTLTAAERIAAPGWVQDPWQDSDPTTDPPAALTRLAWAEPLAQALRPWQQPPFRLHANLAPAVQGAPRRAWFGEPAGMPRRDDLVVGLTPANSIVAAARRGGTAVHLLRAIRLTDGPVLHAPGPAGAPPRPMVALSVEGDAWTLVESLDAAQSFDAWFTATADEDGGIWLGFGDGLRGRAIEVLPATWREGRPDDAAPGARAQDLPRVSVLAEFAVGRPGLGNLGPGTVTELRPLVAGSEAEAATARIGLDAVANVTPAGGGRAPEPMARAKSLIPASLRHGAAERAVTLVDHAAVATSVPGIARARVREHGGPFRTVTVLVDPAGRAELPEALRREVEAALEARRMAGREVVVSQARYVPLDLALTICAAPGTPGAVARARVLSALLPGSADRMGFFHPDRLSFGEALRLSAVLAAVRQVPGVDAVAATRFRRLRDAGGPVLRQAIPLGATEVARLDADGGDPDGGRLVVSVLGLDGARADFDVEALTEGAP